ncbi:MAG: HlyC/CorC family transporter [Betaproteobacteria bacterium]|nr:HlyC/CorC family transporter [Betaproteobacteria bacterium]HMV22306.1 HlyC/CorC family transporter [Rhodocyclaceae bacterium]HMW76327.1 HlyC/CorC family transporter [Rhodocyclaceae bacterium]HNE43782.1 HlyC/CorC family transporter [Rhodocyclaceae bacterium]HNL22024.1 HlyC/CorC family transporter [Rhodocyclaceae bacterium]
MSEIPLSALAITLIVLLALSGFFSLSETAMMAANRFRLRHLAQNGHRGAQAALALLNRTDKLLGVILLGNNLINSAAATLVSVITIELFGEEKWALGAATLAITFSILVFSEITPKIVGATYADRLALVLGYILAPLLRLFYPIVWFINLFAAGLLRIMRLSPAQDQGDAQLSQEELRTLVLESAHLIPAKHRAILANLFDLNAITVEDVMTPRAQIEILDLERSWSEVVDQVSTSHHSRLPVCRESLDQLLGVLAVRRLVSDASRGSLTEAHLLEQLAEPYYIPAGTAAFAQLAFFQENRQRIGFVVDEYGEILGLLTLEDIIEEIVGKFTTSIPGLDNSLSWDENDSVVVEGSRSLRDINRMLSLELPISGPKTLNGLILEHFQDIPEPGVSFKIAAVAIEVLHTQDRSVKTARLFRPPG